MPIKKKTLAPEDLILNLNNKTKKFDVSKYEDFIFELCGDWEFQKDAIRNILKYFISGEYQDTKELFVENYEKNQAMKDFAPKEIFLKNLPFPYKLSCTIDLATATGKSRVIYGVARILLAEDIVDQVLVLCPSKTIKYELHKKFMAFTENSSLTDALPRDSATAVPGIKHSDETIEQGDICIDNVHKTYDHVSSSISDSLERKGSRTLVANDEAHHILNPKGAGEKTKMLEWKKFLDDEKYGFKYILNLSGTPYKGDNYFNDVIYRYSIRDAISQRYIKDIYYLEKDESENWKHKWKAILNNHEELKKEYSKAKKHITIVVTNTIANTDRLAEEIRSFLKEYSNVSDDEVERKVLPVTSSPRHDENRELLKYVDEVESPVEWIVSVSMLTEGWDVKNIFQIVPHEDRAFNSKLLIAQVLGRGLRIPKEYVNDDILPKVWIYNHAAWSVKIDRLVMEVAEISTLLSSNVIKESKYNFDLHYFEIDKQIKTAQKPKGEVEIKLPATLGFHSTKTRTEQDFVAALSRRKRIRTTDISDLIKKYSIEQAANAVYSNLYVFDMERRTNISARVSKDYIRELIKKELKKIEEDFVSEENLQNAKASFNVLLRPFTGVSRIEETYGSTTIKNTSEMKTSYLSESSFKHYGGLVTAKENLKNIDEEELGIIKRIKSEMKETLQTSLVDETYVRARIFDNLKLNQYKSPLDITLLSHKPERDFIEKLVNKYSQYIDAWVKSKDKGFYAIPYIHRPGTHSIQKDFNPDFFIKRGNKIIVVEIKSKDDSTVKNKDKLEGAISYFSTLNEKINNEFRYEFHFLDERDYTTFFENVLVDGKPFTSRLHADLSIKTREELKGEL